MLINKTDEIEAMNDNIDESVILRDYLATQRTHLANERTLLAYLRTAILLLASGLTLIKLFADLTLVVVIGIICIPASLLIAIASYWRYRKLKNEINNPDIKTYREEK